MRNQITFFEKILRIILFIGCFATIPFLHADYEDEFGNIRNDYGGIVVPAHPRGLAHLPAYDPAYDPNIGHIDDIRGHLAFQHNQALGDAFDHHLDHARRMSPYIDDAFAAPYYPASGPLHGHGVMDDGSGYGRPSGRFERIIGPHAFRPAPAPWGGGGPSYALHNPAASWEHEYYKRQQKLAEEEAKRIEKDLRRPRAELYESLETAQDGLHAGYQEQIARLREQLQELAQRASRSDLSTKEADEARAALQAQLATINELQGRVEQLTRSKKELQKRLEAAAGDHDEDDRDAEIDRLREIIRQQREHRKALEKQVEAGSPDDTDTDSAAPPRAKPQPEEPAEGDTSFAKVTRKPLDGPSGTRAGKALINRVVSDTIEDRGEAVLDSLTAILNRRPVDKRALAALLVRKQNSDGTLTPHGLTVGMLHGYVQSFAELEYDYEEKFKQLSRQPQSDERDALMDDIEQDLSGIKSVKTVLEARRKQEKRDAQERLVAAKARVAQLKDDADAPQAAEGTDLSKNRITATRGRWARRARDLFRGTKRNPGAPLIQTYAKGKITGLYTREEAARDRVDSIKAELANLKDLKDKSRERAKKEAYKRRTEFNTTPIPEVEENPHVGFRRRPAHPVASAHAGQSKVPRLDLSRVRALARAH